MAAMQKMFNRSVDERTVVMARGHWEALWMAAQGRPQSVQDSGKLMMVCHDLCSQWEAASSEGTAAE